MQAAKVSVTRFKLLLVKDVGIKLLKISHSNKLKTSANCRKWLIVCTVMWFLQQKTSKRAVICNKILTYVPQTQNQIT